MNVIPQEEDDAEVLAERIISRLSHSNSAIILTTIKVIVYLTNYINNNVVVNALFAKLGAPLLTMLSSEPEIQYVALRNILLIAQVSGDVLINRNTQTFSKWKSESSFVNTTIQSTSN
jgi:AP-2 complex subunit beta-1